MSWLDLIKDKISYLICSVCVTLCIEAYMKIFNVNLFLRLLTAIGFFLAFFIPAILEWKKKKDFYNIVVKGVDSLDKKYIFTELVEEPDFCEGKILYHVAKNVNQNMMDEINVYKSDIKDYKEYIDIWVHEIKTPVASSKLLIENNPSLVTRSIEDELEHVERYIEQVLYYSKLDSVEKDYRINKHSLREIVNEACRCNKKMLIGNKVKITLGELDEAVFTDLKWLLFVVNQILVNCVKYRNDTIPEIKMYSEKKNQQIALYIEDNGIGIREEEVERVLEKGFVGTNGRKSEASTGMGLFICRRLLAKMHHGITIHSIEGEKTIVEITFPTNSYILMN